jgi:uncharacterized Zn-binding protein involved in type VI secretion
MKGARDPKGSDMPASTNVNNRTVVHATSGGICMGMPDVCKTPTPGGPVPIPYPNIAKSQDTAMGSSTVTVDGQPIMLKDSCFAQSTGDEAGSAGGVLSSIIKGKAEFINYSFDVMVEGKNVCRLGDMMLLNNRNTPPAPEVQPPLVVLPSFAVLPSESESETKDWDLTKLEYDEEGDDESQDDGDSGADQNEATQEVGGASRKEGGASRPGQLTVDDLEHIVNGDVANGRDIPSVGLATERNVEDLTRLLTSEASVGNAAEQQAVGSTVINRMNRAMTMDVSDVWNAYAHNQAPSDALRPMAVGLLNGSIGDNTNGSEFYYSPRSMPAEGSPTAGYNVGGGLELINGAPHRNYRPSWAQTYTYQPINGVREWYFKFYSR